MGIEVSAWQLFILLYFATLSLALIVALLYRRWREREAKHRFEALVRQRASLYEMLKILSREAGELSARTDEDLSYWLMRGAHMPEAQALRDVQTELAIVEGELESLRQPAELESSREHLLSAAKRAREWTARVLAARSVGEMRAALSVKADPEAVSGLARANDRIRQFALSHGIKETESFYHDSHFYV